MNDNVSGTFAQYLTVTQAANFLGVSPWTLRNWDNAGKLKPERHPVNGYRIYREQDLQAILQSGNLSGKRKSTLTPNFDWHDINSSEHFVQFYETDAFLVESLCGYLATGLLAGEGAIVFGTQDHRKRIEKKLTARGVDLPAVREAGQYVAFDAAKTLSKIVRDGSPDRALFSEVIETKLSKLVQKWPRVRAFGEIVALLCEEGNREGAYVLEEFWNDLAKKLSFALFCAYPMSEFSDAEDDAVFTHICTCHTRVLPTESYSALSTMEEQLREISSLQQKAKALEGEIAQRQEAEKERALLAAIIEFSDDAIVSKDLNGIITSWNRGAESVFGYSAAETVGRSVTMLIPEDRLEEEELILGRIRRGERVEHYETIRRRKDGTLLNISLTISPVIDSQGRIIGASKIARDVTERKKSEERLSQSEERYRRLAELLPVGVYICEAPSGRITYYNQQAARLWGRAPKLDVTVERFCGSYRIILPETGEIVPREECPMAVTLREGTTFRNREAIIMRPDGSRLTVLVNIDPIRDSNGRVVGSINVFHDISAIKEAEQVVWEQKENLQTLLETMPVGVLIAHDAECRHISGNRAAEELLRAPQDANLSRFAPPTDRRTNFRILKNGESVAPEDLPMQRAARAGEIVHSEELDLRFDDDTTIHTLVSAQPLYDVDGRPRGAVGSVLDITELKNAENALREADRRKDEFLATLAHELRNPLAPIRTGLELMKYVKDDPEAMEETRDTMERQTQQLITLVNDLLDVSRITRGKFELRKTQVTFEDIVRSGVEASRPLIDEAGHELVVCIPEQAMFLEADPHRLAQVLSNLLNNAAKYTPPGGRIRLSAEQQGTDLVLAVKDNGIGIPVDQLDNIFEMFAQIDREGETGHTGLGIGLTLVKLLVCMHGGSIQAHSEGLKRGTTFTVRLPIVIPSPIEEATAPPTKPESANNEYRVLVVDDNKDAAEMLSRVVKKLGNEVRMAGDGHQAVAVAGAFRPDVVLMDLGMPGMDGYEAARCIRKEPWGKDITLVALTGWGQEEDKRRTLESGFDHHLVKPAEPAALENLFAELNQGSAETCSP